MKLAVNYSSALIQLIESGALTVDLIKCPDWEGMLEEAQPFGEITIHFDLKAGLSQTFNTDLTRFEQLLNQTSTPHVNTHLVGPQHLDDTDSEQLSWLIALWREEISLLTHHFGADTVVLEHFPYTFNTPHLRLPSNPQVFSGIIQDTNCMLLLDLAHAKITADTLSMNVKDYIQSLPLDRLAEMHVTGVKRYAGVLTDHFGLSAEDWDLFNWAIQNIHHGKWRQPEIVAFEYGGAGNVFVWRTDKRILQEQVPRLYKTVHQ